MKEAFKFQPYQLLDQGIAIQAVQHGLQILQQRTDSIQLGIRLGNFVKEMPKLGLGNLRTRRHGPLLEFEFELLLHLAKSYHVLGAEDHHGNPCLAGSGRTAATVGVHLGIIGNGIMHNVGDVPYVNASGRYIGGHHQLQGTFTEAGHHLVPLHLGQIPVQGLEVVAFPNQFLGQFLSLGLGTGEDDAVHLRMGVNQTLEGFVFTREGNLVKPMFQTRGRGCSGIAAQGLGILQEAVRHFLDLGRHGGREQPGTATTCGMGHDIIQVIAESHIQHLIRFIQNQRLDRSEIQGLAFH